MSTSFEEPGGRTVLAQPIRASTTSVQPDNPTLRPEMKYGLAAANAASENSAAAGQSAAHALHLIEARAAAATE